MVNPAIATTTVAPTVVKVIAPPSVEVKPADAPEVIVVGENLEITEGTELQEVTLLKDGDEIQPEDIVVPADVVEAETVAAEPETMVVDQEAALGAGFLGQGRGSGDS